MQTIQSVKLLRDGVIVNEWTNQTPGAELAFADNVSSSSDYVYSVVCNNNGSDSEIVTITVNVPLSGNNAAPTQNTDYGADTSKVNGYYGKNYNAHAIYVPGEGIKIKWAYPLSAYYENQIPEGQDLTTATVTRVGDDKVLVENSSEGVVMDADVDDSERVTYQYKLDLTRYTNKKTVNSSIVSLNNPMPFFPGISSTALYEFTVIDADGDNTAWSQMVNGDAAKHGATKWFVGNHSSKNNGDDWLITPGLKVEAGKTYRVDIDALCPGIIESPVQFMVTAGRSNTIEAMTDTVIPVTKFQHLTPKTYSGFYTAKEDGNIFFGFRSFECNGDFALSRIYIDEVSNDIPQAVDLIHVAYSPTKAGEATISFNAPTKNIVGEDLTALTKIELYRNNVLIETYENPTPGQSFSKDITFDLGSQDEYKTIPYTAAGAGLETIVKVMVLEPPYENSFDSENDITGFTVIDPQESGYTWNYMAINKAMRAYPDRNEGQDDYLITPPMHLEAGSFYKINFLTWLGTADVNNYYNNKLEVLIGTAPTREALTTTIVPAFYVRGGFDTKALAKDWFTVPETGEYYIAWHVMAEPNLGQEVYLDDIKISDKIPGTYPDGVDNLEIKPDPEGELQVTLTYNIPMNDLLGNPLEGNVYNTVVYRDGIQVANQMSQKPGTAITVTDKGTSSNPMTQGVHLYTVTCYGGTSSATATPTRDRDQVVYVGINRPGAVDFLDVEENPDNYGEVTFKWGAPTVDIDGFPINTSNFTYTIGEYKINNVTGETWEVVYEQDFKPEDGKLEYTKTVMTSTSGQEFKRFIVRANTVAGKGNPTMRTPWMAVGVPFTLPYTESFKNSNSEHNMLLEYIEGGWAAWGYNTYNPVTGVQPVDNDRGLGLMEAEFIDHSARLYTARINLNVPNPRLTMYVYNQTNTERTDDNLLGISLREGNDGFKTVASKTINEWAGGKPGWQKISVDLSEYAGKIVYVGFDGTAKSMRFIHVDKIVIGAPEETDLALTNLVNDKVYVGVDHNIKATVKNNGSKTVENASVTLKLDDEEVESLEVGAIAPDEESVVMFTKQLGRDAIGSHEYTAVLTVEGDADLLDNNASAGTFTLNDNNFPTVENLAGDKVDTQVNLRWDEPNVPDEAKEITDDFESYPSWSTMYTGIGDYTLIDKDGYAIGGFQGVEIPNIPYGSKQSFTLWDFSDDIFAYDDTYRAYSGDKCLVSIFNPAAYEWTHDQLISPALCGKAQTISFYAKAYSDVYPESFQVFYSNSGMKDADFEGHNFKKETVGGEWTKFTYELPEGATYFMIEHYSKGGYFLFVDDLTYTPVGDETLVLKGYNVYRENDKLTPSPISEQTWIDNGAVPNAVNNYSVSAVYDRGESPLANVAVDMKQDGAEDGFTNGVSVSVDGQEIVITGAQGLNFSVVNMAGMVLTSRKADATTRIPVSPGVYVVNVAGTMAKVLVK